jgi:hypothetical protein
LPSRPGHRCRLRQRTSCWRNTPARPAMMTILISIRPSPHWRGWSTGWRTGTRWTPVCARPSPMCAKRLANGLGGVGKTKVGAKVSWSESATPEAPAGEGKQGDTWRLLLVTPSLLTDPRSLRPAGARVKAGSGSRDVQFAAYKQVWDELSEGQLELVRYFHDQSLAGGEFLRGRFQAGLAAYWPYLLTEPGSVFVLRAKDTARGKALLTKWLSSGLPLSGWVDELYGRNGLPGGDWRSCRFVPAKGYGEIALNPEWPAELGGGNG